MKLFSFCYFTFRFFAALFRVFCHKIMDYKLYVGFAILGLFAETVTAVDPVFKDNSSNVTAIQGEDAVLPCAVSNTSDITQVNWMNPNGQQLTNDETVLMQSDRFSVVRPTTMSWNLHIKNVDVSDSGTYVCEISSSILQKKSVYFTVQAPVILNQFGSGVVNETTQSPSTEDPSKCSGIRPCENGGTCMNGTCNCTFGFAGVFCQVPTVCPEGTCNINNTFNCSVEQENGSYKYKCNCITFYEGERCDVYDFCLSYPCNNGNCELLYPNPQSGYKCHCRTGDKNCKLNRRDECKMRPPSNENSFITCIDQIESHKMYCSPGFSGELRGCSTPENPQLFCDQNGPGYCKDEGYCKPLCNVDVCNGTENCNFTVDPYSTTGFNSKPDCIKDFGDGYDHIECHDEDTLFDGFDKKINGLTDCSPFFDTICTRDFGNEECKPECNNPDCLYDGFDCDHDNGTELTGVVVVELKESLEVPLDAVQKNLSMMLRSRVNLTEEEFLYEPVKLLSLTITETANFTSIEYAGKFLAAVVAKRPIWLDGVKIKDIFVCPAGSYSESQYSKKCSSNCSTCSQTGEICDWKTGECLYGCPVGHSGPYCSPCDTCIQEGDVCDWGSGKCLHGCKPGHWGDKCSPCITCNQTGDVCNNKTGECLHGCTSDNYYGPNCNQCPQNCVGGCSDTGRCLACPPGLHGETCKSLCDSKCQNSTCEIATGICICQLGYYWSEKDKWCEACSNGCNEFCEATSGRCTCRDGYHGNRCNFHCNKECLNGTCHVNGTCDKGCDAGYYGVMCNAVCPVGCQGACARDGLCEGNCKPGFEGSQCETRSSYIGDVTDNTGVIVGVIISFLLVVLIIVVACCYWKKRQSGDYVMEDEEMEEPLPKEANTIQVHTNMHLQPASSPLLGHSMDMIELDEKHNTAIYAGPGRGQAEETEDRAPNGKGPEEREEDNAQSADDNTDDNTDDTDKTNKRCTSSVVMEIGMGGRVLSVSDAEEVPSPTLKNEAEEPIGEEEAESMEDDSAFVEPPPHSPLGEVRAPLASEENILASLGPKELEQDTSNEPAGLDEDTTNEDDKDSRRSRSSTSSSCSSDSNKSSKSSKGDNKEITTEM